VAFFRSVRLRDQSWILLLEGVISIAAGVATFVWPHITAFALLLLISFWALALGVAEFIAAIRLRKVIRGEWLLALKGILTVALGALLLIHPRAGILAFVWLVGAYAIAFGVVLVAHGIRLRSWGHIEHPRPQPA
jgi:uncharacterized membrane protein HdeD (DUF308 family)